MNKYSKIKPLLFLSLYFVIAISCNINNSSSSNNGKNLKESINNTSIENIDTSFQKTNIDNNSILIDSVFNESIYFLDTVIECNHNKKSLRVLVKKKEIKGKYYNGYLDNQYELEIETDDSIIFKRNLTKESFGIDNDDFMDRAILYSMILKDVNFEKKEVTFFSNVLVPETDYDYAFYIIIELASDTLIYSPID